MADILNPHEAAQHVIVEDPVPPPMERPLSARARTDMDITALHGRVTALETNEERTMDAIAELRKEMHDGFKDLRNGILSVFSKLGLALILVVVVCIVAITGVVGAGVYFKGYGIEVGSAIRTSAPVRAAQQHDGQGETDAAP